MFELISLLKKMCFFVFYIPLIYDVQKEQTIKCKK